MKRLYHYLYRFVDFLVLAMLLLIVTTISLNVVARYFGRAFTWIDELSRLAFVWMSFMAIVAGLRRKLHPSFNLLLRKMSGLGAKLLLSLINLLILVFLLYLLSGGIAYITRVYLQTTAILKISVAWKYAAVPVAAALMSIEIIKQLVMLWKDDSTVWTEQRSEVI